MLDYDCVASSWTLSDMGPVKVRLSDCQRRVGPIDVSRGRLSEGGVKKLKSECINKIGGAWEGKKAKKQVWELSWICRGTVWDPIVPSKRARPGLKEG